MVSGWSNLIELIVITPFAIPSLHDQDRGNRCRRMERDVLAGDDLDVAWRYDVGVGDSAHECCEDRALPLFDSDPERWHFLSLSG